MQRWSDKERKRQQHSRNPFKLHFSNPCTRPTSNPLLPLAASVLCARDRREQLRPSVLLRGTADGPICNSFLRYTTVYLWTPLWTPQLWSCHSLFLSVHTCTQSAEHPPGISSWATVIPVLCCYGYFQMFSASDYIPAYSLSQWRCVLLPSRPKQCLPFSRF